jgi:hypothetical protein
MHGALPDLRFYEISTAARNFCFIGHSSKVFGHHVATEFSCPVELCRMNTLIFILCILLMQRRINVIFQVFMMMKPK